MCRATFRCSRRVKARVYYCNNLLSPPPPCLYFFSDYQTQNVVGKATVEQTVEQDERFLALERRLADVTLEIIAACTLLARETRTPFLIPFFQKFIVGLVHIRGWTSIDTNNAPLKTPPTPGANESEKVLFERGLQLHNGVKTLKVAVREVWPRAMIAVSLRAPLAPSMLVENHPLLPASFLPHVVLPRLSVPRALV